MDFVTAAEELMRSSWWLAGISCICFSVRLNLPGLKSSLFGSSAAFAFGKAGEVLPVSFLHKLLLPLLEQSGHHLTFVVAMEECVCIFCLQQKCSTSTMEFFAVSVNDILRKVVL